MNSLVDCAGIGAAPLRRRLAKRARTNNFLSSGDTARTAGFQEKFPEATTSCISLRERWSFATLTLAWGVHLRGQGKGTAKMKTVL